MNAGGESQLLTSCLSKTVNNADITSSTYADDRLSRESEIKSVIELNSNQIFIGMVSTQYKAKIVGAV